MLARQRNPQTLGHEGHERGLQLRILQDSRRETRSLAGFIEPIAKTWMRLLRHANKKHCLERCEIYPALSGQRMFYRQNHDRLMPGDALPLQPSDGCRRTQPYKAQVNFADFQGAKLFCRRHVEEVQRNVREDLAESSQRVGQQLEIKI